MAGKGNVQTGMTLALRLRAWWEGYDPKQIQARLDERARLLEAQRNAAREKAAAARASKQPEHMDKEDLVNDPWDADKVNIAQYIWGDGFCGPGGPEYIIALSKLMALSPEMSMIQLGASLGGPARVLSEKFGVWINGYEESKTLVERGNELSKMAGMEKKVTLEQYNPDEMEEFERKFDRAIAKEALFTIENKKHIISCVEDKLKPGGLFLITDYFLGSDSVVSKDSYKEWKTGERHAPYPILIDEMKDLLKDKKMQVRVSEDITEAYIDMINKAWAGADDVAARLAKEEDGPRLIQILMQEAEYWTRRKKLMEKGDIRLWRIVASKKAHGPSMMSDW